MPSRELLKRENILAIVAVLGIWSFLIQFTASQKSLKSESGMFYVNITTVGPTDGPVTQARPSGFHPLKVYT